jgi:hypothetical protein
MFKEQLAYVYKVQIQSRYDTHRTNRNAQQRAKYLSPDFTGVTIDDILAKLEDSSIEPGFQDWRNCLVFWARPPAKLRSLIAEIQKRILEIAPNTWTMPQLNLHMTAMEVTHSQTHEQIDSLVEKLSPAASAIADYTFDHRVRLVKPMVSYDAQALALSLLPAVGEGGRSLDKDKYTYHHLRRDLFEQIQAAGVKVGSRYVIPSAHLTIARFITKKDFEAADGKVDHAKIERLIAMIDDINQWLQKEFWPKENGEIQDGGDWIVGEEKGLDFHMGRLWYGDGERVHLGKGF